MNIPITRERIKTHFAYAWWQYALMVIIAIFGWNLLHTVTRYRSPETLKVEWYCDGYGALLPQKNIDDLMARLRAELFPEMEEVSFVPVGSDPMYGEMQLTAWVSAGQGDVYTLALERFERLALGGAMVDLQPYIDSGALNVNGLDLQNGYVTDEETGEKRLMGIPMDALTGLESYGIACEGRVLSLLSTGGNVDNALRLIAWLLSHMAS